MNTGFKDRLKAVEKDEPEMIDKRLASGKVPYDKRTACYVGQGNHYGVGVTQPVGTEKHNPQYAVPVGRVNTLKVDNDL